jgi:RHS repeat-associated protein
MGCPKITYNYREEGLERSTIDFCGHLAEKRGQQKNCQDYYPFGLTFNEWTRSPENLYKYNGKEEQKESQTFDFGFRHYDPALARWSAVDPLAENSISMTPYHYVGNNPIAFVDPNGLDWFYYKEDGADEADWHWQDGSEYNTGVKDDDGNDIILQGTEAVVVFSGFTKEQMGTEKNHVAGSKSKSNQYLNNNGSIMADVTVYGPDGADDISHYKGYTTSSDPETEI